MIGKSGNDMYKGRKKRKRKHAAKKTRIGGNDGGRKYIYNSVRRANVIVANGMKERVNLAMGWLLNIWKIEKLPLK